MVIVYFFVSETGLEYYSHTKWWVCLQVMGYETENIFGSV